MRRFALSFIALALTSCGSDQSAPAGEDLEEGADYRIEQEGDGLSLSVRTDKGTVHVKSGSKLAVDLPEGYTLYPGAEVVSNTLLNEPGGKAIILTMTSTDSAEKMTEFYRRQAEAAGVKIHSVMKSDEVSVISGKQNDGHIFTFNANSGEAVTTAQLTVSISGRG